jgi:hypothetical protein
MIRQICLRINTMIELPLVSPVRRLYALPFNGAIPVETVNLSHRPLHTQRLASRPVSRDH